MLCRCIKLFCLLTFTSTISSVAIAGQLTPGWATVEGLFTFQEGYGHCMVQIDGYTGSSECATDWATLDCQGSFLSKSQARTNMELVQMALALNSRIYARIDDTRKHNGYCLLYSVQIMNEN